MTSEHKGTVLLCTFLVEKYWGICLEKISLVAAVSSFCLFPISCTSFCPAKFTEEFEFSNQSIYFVPKLPSVPSVVIVEFCWNDSGLQCLPSEHKGTVLLCTFLAEKYWGICLEKFWLVAPVCSFCLFPISCAGFCPAKLTEEFEFSNQSHLFCP